jgi:hypothetical protein
VNKLSNEKLASQKTGKIKTRPISRVFTHKQESVIKQETTSQRLTQKCGSSTKSSQSNLASSPYGSTGSMSSRRGSHSETASVSEAEVEIMIADIPLEPVNVDVAQRAVLADSIHHLEQIQPILIWNKVSSSEC